MSETTTLQRALVTIQKLKKLVKEQPHLEPIAIVGMACRVPTANDKNSFWDLLADNKNIISACPETRWQLLKGSGENEKRIANYSYWGGYLEGIDLFDAYYFGITPREAARMDPQQRLLMEVCFDAIEDAGIAADSLTGTNTGVFASVYASQYGHLQKLENEMDALYLPTGNAISIASNRLSYLLDTHGPSFTIDSACSSSLVATHLACLHLQNRLCNLAIVSAANINLLPSLNLLLSQAHMLSPDGQCKTFDENANGYVQGEGVGALILKPLSKALEDNDRIYAVIQGGAVNQDGKTNGLTAPNGLQQEAVIKTACERAQISPDKISYVECHGTGTFLGDPIEIEALGNVLKPNAQHPCYIGSVKTNIGHLEPAAGIASLIKLALSLYHKEIPAHLNVTKLNPHINFDKYGFAIPTKLIDWPEQNEIHYAGVSGFGFGGTNAHLILRNLTQEEVAINKESSTPEENSKKEELFVLSAKDDEALNALIKKWLSFLPTTSSDLATLCYNLQLRKNHYAKRIAIIAKNKKEVITYLESLLDNLPQKQYSGNNEIEKIANNYLTNLSVDWREMQGERKLPVIDMPTYAWQHKSYWAEFASNIQENPSVDSLASRYLYTPLESRVFEFTFDTKTLPELGDTYNVLHAGYYFEMIAYAMQKLKGSNTFSLKNFAFIKALFVPNNKKVTVQLILEETVTGIYSAKFYSLTSENEVPEWILHAEGELHLDTLNARLILPKQENLSFTDADKLYERIQQMGMPAGDSIRWTKQFHVMDQEIICDFAVPVICQNKLFHLGIHPGVVDGSIQPIFALLPKDIQKGYMASKIGKVNFYGMHEGDLRLVSELHPLQANEKTITCDWYLFAGNQLVLSCEEMQLQQLERKIDISKITSPSQVEFDNTQNQGQLTQQVRTIIHGMVASIFAMPEKDIPLNKPLRELGLDSLMALTLHSTLTKTFTFPVAFPNNLLTENITINNLVDMIAVPVKNKVEKNIWIATHSKVEENGERTRLFCFPYGGGGASIYANWQTKLDKSIEVCAIQLPGREIRLNESPIMDMDELIKLLLENLHNNFDQPFAFFGHSLGALVAFELTRSLRKYGLHLPQQLFISAFPDPRLPPNNLLKMVKELQDVGVELADFNDTDKIEKFTEDKIKLLSEVLQRNGLTAYGDHLQNRDILKTLLPIFGADMSLILNYRYRDEAPLDVPLNIFYGKYDKWVTYPEMVGWQDQTTSSCDFYSFPGAHLFLKDEVILMEMLRIISKKMLNISINSSMP